MFPNAIWEQEKTITQDIAKYILELEVTDIEFVDKELQRIERRGRYQVMLMLH